MKKVAKEAIDIGKLIDEETERRLAIMEADDYEWPEKADKKDAVAIVGIIIVCLALIVCCMTGVIV